MRLFPEEFRLMGWIYLIELLVPLVFSFAAPVLAQRLAGVAGTVAFAALYVLSFRVRRAWIVACLEVVIVAAMEILVNPGFTWLIIYPTALLTVRYDLKRMAWYLVAIDAVAGGAALAWRMVTHTPGGVFLSQEVPSLMSAVVVASAVAVGSMWQRRVMAAKEALLQANQRIEQLTMSAERERISRDLHDVIGHDLSLIALKAQLIERLIEREPEAARREARETGKAARESLSRVRQYIAGMRQPDIQAEFGAAQRILEAAGISCQAVADTGRAPTRGASAALAMCLRESVTNLVRHSGAKRASIRLRMTDGEWQLTVADDGRGMGAGMVAAMGDGRGVAGMLARMAAVEGQAAAWSRGEWVRGSPPEATASLPFRRGTAWVFTVAVGGTGSGSAAPPDRGASRRTPADVWEVSD